LPPESQFGQCKTKPCTTVRQGLTNALSQQRRGIAVQAHQDEIDGAKFAVQQAIGLSTAAASAAVSFIQAPTASLNEALQLRTSKGQTPARSARAGRWGTAREPGCPTFASANAGARRGISRCHV